MLDHHNRDITRGHRTCNRRHASETQSQLRKDWTRAGILFEIKLIYPRSGKHEASLMSMNLKFEFPAWDEWVPVGVRRIHTESVGEWDVRQSF